MLYPECNLHQLILYYPYNFNFNNIYIYECNFTLQHAMLKLSKSYKIRLMQLLKILYIPYT